MKTWFLEISETQKYMEVVRMKRILTRNSLIYIGLHCVNRSLWITTTLATLTLVTGLRNECSPSFLRDGNYLIIMSSPTDLWAISIHHPWSQKLQIMYFAIKKSLKATRYVFLSPAVIIRSLAPISVRDTIRTENYVHFFDSWPICRFYNFPNECREFAKFTQDVELVSKELNHLAAILHVYAGGLNFMK